MTVAEAEVDRIIANSLNIFPSKGKNSFRELLVAKNEARPIQARPFHWEKMKKLALQTEHER